MRAGAHLFLRTNQTTLEHLSPFLLLRQMPPLPQHASDRFRLSDPPLEHELSFSQRRLVRDAHGYIRLYDVGWRKNWAQVLGWDRPWGWVYRIAIGGGGYVRSCRHFFIFSSSSDTLRVVINDDPKLIDFVLRSHRMGDGTSFPRNPKADELLARLASELVDVDKVL